MTACVPKAVCGPGLLNNRFNAIKIVELLTPRRNPYNTPFKFYCLKCPKLIYKILTHKLKPIIVSLMACLLTNNQNENSRIEINDVYICKIKV